MEYMKRESSEFVSQWDGEHLVGIWRFVNIGTESYVDWYRGGYEGDAQYPIAETRPIIIVENLASGQIMTFELNEYMWFFEDKESAESILASIKEQV